MSIFKLQSAESNDEVDIYMVTIIKTKANVFQLVHHYVVCGATFRMKTNLVAAAYDVLTNLFLWAYSDHLLVSCSRFRVYFNICGRSLLLFMGPHTRARCTLICGIEYMMDSLFTTSTFMRCQCLNGILAR